MPLRVPCPTCGNPGVTVRSNGTLRHHTNKNAPRHGSRFAPVCASAGQPAPDDALNTAVAAAIMENNRTTLAHAIPTLDAFHPHPATTADPVPTAADIATDEDAWAAMLTAAATRVDYRLTYAATRDPRPVDSMGVDGPAIPDAYDPTKTGPGRWDDPDFALVVHTPTHAIERWLASAVAEAVHEALEWFKVDGTPLLDPHGQHEGAIHDATAELTATLTALLPDLTRRPPSDT